MTTPPVVYDSATQSHPLIQPFKNIWEKRDLIKLLVARDLTLRYKRSVLGVWWTILNPLLTTLVFWFVFSNIFSRTGEGEAPFVVYLLSGTLLISTFFSQGVLAGGSALMGSRNILSRVKVPGEVFAVTASLAAAVNIVIGIAILAALQIFTGWGVPWTVVLIPIPLFAMLLLVTGLGMLIASAAIHFYDVLDFVRVLLGLVIWLVPTFYPLDILDGNPMMQDIIRANPLYSYLTVFRGFMYEGVFAPTWNFVYMFASALVVMILGVWVFSKSWRQAVVMM